MGNPTESSLKRMGFPQFDKNFHATISRDPSGPSLADLRKKIIESDPDVVLVNKLLEDKYAEM